MEASWCNELLLLGEFVFSNTLSSNCVSKMFAPQLLFALAVNLDVAWHSAWSRHLWSTGL